MSKYYVVRFKYHESEEYYRETYMDLIVALYAYEKLEVDLRRVECCMLEDSEGKVLASR